MAKALAAAVAAGKAVVAAVATLFNTVAALHATHGRGTRAYVSYRIAGANGIVFLPVSMFTNGVAPATLTFGATPASGVTKGNTALVYRRAVAGGSMGRHSFAVAGLPGTITVCATLLPVGASSPVQAYVKGTPFAAAVVTAAKTTAAVVAAGNLAVARKTGKGANGIAAPKAVAAVAAKQVVTVLRATNGAAVATTQAAANAIHQTQAAAALAQPPSAAAVAAGMAAAAAVLAVAPKA